MLAATPLYDRLAHGRLHPVSLWGAVIFVVFANVLSAVVSPNPVWQRFVLWQASWEGGLNVLPASSIQRPPSRTVVSFRLEKMTTGPVGRGSQPSVAARGARTAWPGVLAWKLWTS